MACNNSFCLEIKYRVAESALITTWQNMESTDAEHTQAKKSMSYITVR